MQTGASFPNPSEPLIATFSEGSICYSSFGRLQSAFFIPDVTMTEVSRIADSTMFKLIVPILQTVISLGALAAFSYVVSSLSSLQVALNNYQTTQAVTIQRIGSIERTLDAYGVTLGVVKTSTEKQEYRVDTLTDAVKQLTLNGRPK